MVQLPDTSTGGLESPVDDARGAATRRGFLIVLGAAVVAGGAGLLGVRTGRRTVVDGSWSLTLSYPTVARPGQDVSWRLVVRRDGGLPERVRLAVTRAYFTLYDSDGFRPVPDEQSSDTGTWYVIFTPPPHGDTMAISYEGTVPPMSWAGRAGTVAVLDGDGERASLRFRTRLIP